MAFERVQISKDNSETKVYHFDYFMSFVCPLQKFMRHEYLIYKRNQFNRFEFPKESTLLFRMMLGICLLDGGANIYKLYLLTQAGQLNEAKNVSTTFSIVIYLTLRGLSLISKYKVLEKVLNKFDDLFPKSAAEQERMKVPEYVELLRKRFAYFHNICFFITFGYMLTPITKYILFYDGTVPIPDYYHQLASWLPFGLKEKPSTYPFSYLITCYQTLIGSFTVYTQDHPFTVMIYHLKMHFEYLILRIKELDARDSMRPETAHEFYRKFEDCLVYHRNIASLSVDMNSIFDMGILALNFFASISICFHLYLIANTTDVFAIVNYLMSLSVMVWFTFEFSLRGQELETLSSKVVDAVYAHNWYEGSTFHQKQMTLSLQQTSKVCKLTAMQLFDVNMLHFRKMMSLAYQLFTFLHTR